MTEKQMEAEDYAELYRLRAAVKGPDGFETWQDAATDERIRRVKAESDIKALAKEDRAIRRLLCIHASDGHAYMDDGEAQDQEIDFLRDSAEVIEYKLRERNLKKWKEQQNGL
jgi:hypothetical protein